MPIDYAERQLVRVEARVKVALLLMCAAWLNNSKCKGASSIATCGAPNAHFATISWSSPGADELEWIGHSLSRHMARAI